MWLKCIVYCCVFRWSFEDKSLIYKESESKTEFPLSIGSYTTALFFLEKPKNADLGDILDPNSPVIIDVLQHSLQHLGVFQILIIAISRYSEIVSCPRALVIKF